MCPREASLRWAAWSCVLLAVLSADPEINVYKKVGDEVVLKPGGASVTGTVISILWKHGNDFAMDFDELEIEAYRQFKERGSLNLTNGEMTITGLTRNDSGLYTSEINGEQKSPNLRLIVIPPVPKPTVGTSCDNERTSCTLTCDGDTADAGLVTYRWRLGDEGTAGSKELLITKAGSLGVDEFSCELENTVSRESSQPVHNPFSTTPEGKLNINTGVAVFVTLLVAVLLLVALHKCKTGMWFFQKTSMPWELNFWRKNEKPPRGAAESNGTQGQADEEIRLS